jgi:hypothetical protein
MCDCVAHALKRLRVFWNTPFTCPAVSGVLYTVTEYHVASKFCVSLNVLGRLMCWFTIQNPSQKLDSDMIRSYFAEYVPFL